MPPPGIAANFLQEGGSMARNKKDPGKLLSSAVMLFYFSAFLLIACKDYAWQGLALALAVPAMIGLVPSCCPGFSPRTGCCFP